MPLSTPTEPVTSNHWPRFTESGAAMSGVCLGSRVVRGSRDSA